MKAYARPIILVLAAIVLGASVYALYVHYRLLSDPAYSPACNISETVSCQQVFQSSYGTVYGVPIAAGGAIWAGLVLLLAGLGMGSTDRERVEAATGYVFLLSVAGLASVFYYAYASFVVLQAQCPVCIAMYVAIVGIFLVSSSTSSVSLGSLPGRLARDVRAMFMGPIGATLGVLWVVGAVSLVAFFPREVAYTVAPDPAAAAPPTEALDAAQLAEWQDWLDSAPRVAEMAPSGAVKVRFVKFNDYQCPSCRATWLAYRDLVARWEAEHPEAFEFETRDFPLEVECGSGGMHAGACEAAVAVRLAREKGRGPEMEAWVFDHQAELTRDRVEDAVREVAGVEDFAERYASVLADVRKDAQLGSALGVDSTPTFYLNGIKMGAVRVAYLDAAIAHELQKAGGQS